MEDTIATVTIIIYSGAVCPQLTYHQNASAMVTILKEYDSFSARHLGLSQSGIGGKKKE